MNDHELDLALADFGATRVQPMAPPVLRQRIRTMPLPTEAGRGWLPESPKWSFQSTFSALKFIAAGVIVALFGGFLLAGILTTQQGDEALPAAVTESPEPEATTAPTEPQDPLVRTDILPGITLTLDEVETGVFRVIDDGVRDLAKANNTGIVAGHNDSIWLVRLNRFFRLGSDKAHEWATTKPVVDDFEVAPDGTVWTQQDGGIQSFDGEGWMTHNVDGLVEVTSDGTVWAVWREDPEGPEGVAFGYLGADGWQSVEWPDEWLDTGPPCSKGARCAFLVSDRGEVWALAGGTTTSAVQHFVDGSWRTYDGVDDVHGLIRNAAVGADGTLWGSTRAGFFRFDGTEWTIFEWYDGFLADVFPRHVFGWGEFHVAPDGSLWVAPQPGECGPDRCGCDHGVTRFDGMSWGRYLPDLCVEAFDITADGSVWLLASEEMLTTFDPEQQEWVFAGDAKDDLYVITPEAVAADG